MAYGKTRQGRGLTDSVSRTAEKGERKIDEFQGSDFSYETTKTKDSKLSLNIK